MDGNFSVVRVMIDVVLSEAVCFPVGSPIGSNTFHGPGAKIFEDNVNGMQINGVTDDSRLNQAITNDPRLISGRDHKSMKIHSGMLVVQPTAVANCNGYIANSTKSESGIESQRYLFGEPLLTQP